MSNRGASCHVGMRLSKMNAPIRDQCEGDETNSDKRKLNEKVSIRSEKRFIISLLSLTTLLNPVVNIFRFNTRRKFICPYNLVQISEMTEDNGIYFSPQHFIARLIHYLLNLYQLLKLNNFNFMLLLC